MNSTFKFKLSITLTVIFIFVHGFALAGKVIFYKNLNYDDKLLNLGPGIYDMADLDDKKESTSDVNDAISSLKINDKNLRVTLYEKKKFGGEAVTFYESVSYVGDLINDKTSSIVIENIIDRDDAAPTFYEHPEYGGRMIALGVGLHNQDVINDRLGNDKISSFKIPAELRVTLYKNSNFTGNCKSFDGKKKVSALSNGWNDEISSIIIEKIPSPDLSATFYKDASYKGTNAAYSIGRYDKDRLSENHIGNDTISSIKVPSGLKVTVFKDEGFTGDCKTYKLSTIDVGDDWNDKISSIVVEEYVKHVDSSEVTFYEDKNYGGNSRRLNAGRYNRSSLNKKDYTYVGNDKISSIRVSRGLKVTIYEDDNFAKKQKSFYKDVEYVGDFINDMTTSIIIEKWEDPDAVTYILIADPQIACVNCGGYVSIDVAFQRIVDAIDSLDRLNWPSQVQGTDTTLEMEGKPVRPQAMVFLGDLVNWSASDKRNKFEKYYNFKKNRGSAIQLYGYIGLGNHDFAGNGGAMIDMLKDLNIKNDAPLRAESFDEKSLSYSWYEKKVRFIQCNRFGGDNVNEDRGDDFGKFDPEECKHTYDDNSLSWLVANLLLPPHPATKNPVLLFQHYNWPKEGDCSYWSDRERDNLERVLSGKKVIRFHGHDHMFKDYTYNGSPVFGLDQNYNDRGDAAFYLLRVKSDRLELVECVYNCNDNMTPVPITFNRVFIYDLSTSPITQLINIGTTRHLPK
ncbi:MAG: hypothetical protein LWX51_11825 [Deltaproteobacteria bacterium]|jgi:hypothetical protein|nr:hypothetical protein [Deltaproteobacteria bacterium]